MEKARGYFTKTITPESLVKIYEALGRELKGKVAVSIHTVEAAAALMLGTREYEIAELD